MESFIIYPNLKKTINMVKFTNIQILEYRLFESAYICCDLMDENDIFIEQRQFLLNNSNGFNLWGMDDKFIVNFIKTELIK